MCGITTGGQDECWWDCMIISDSILSGQAITNPECMKDCFAAAASGRRRSGKKERRNKKKGRKGGKKGRQTRDSDSNCLALLIDDVTSKGTCDDGNNPAKELDIWGWSNLANDCTMEEPPCEYYCEDEYQDYDYSAPMIITEGTCSADTEAALQTDECKTLLENQPNIIKNTLELLIQYSCKTEVYDSLPFSQGLRKGQKKRRNRNKPNERLAPISEVDLAAGTKTELNFTNTRHRYPWICSLRTRGADPEHLCAVNLLSVPPNPTVIVGSAHCTYLCKDTDANGVSLPPCCCVDSAKGQESCSSDTVKCGSKPKGVEMDGRDAEILCGEWQTGAYGQTTSGEEYNVVLPIEEIVRSPNFDAKTLGPAGGSNIAVFKVNDDQLQASRKNKIYPACLPPKG